MNSDHNDVCMVLSDKLENELVLLDLQQQQISDLFLRDFIYSQVVTDWANSTTNLSENWKDHNTLRYKVTPDLVSKWSELYAEYLKIISVENTIKADKEVRSILKIQSTF
jgi:hypothetical protein